VSKVGIKFVGLFWLLLAVITALHFYVTYWTIPIFIGIWLSVLMYATIMEDQNE